MLAESGILACYPPFQWFTASPQISSNLSSDNKLHNQVREMTPFDKPQLPKAARTPKSFYQAAE